MPDTSVPYSQEAPVPVHAKDLGDGTFGYVMSSQSAMQATLLGAVARTTDPPIPVIANPDSLVRGLRLWWTFTAIPATGVAPVMSIWEVEPITGLLIQKGTLTLAAPPAATVASAGAPVFKRLVLYPTSVEGAAAAPINYEVGTTAAGDLMVVGAFDRALQVVIHHGDTSSWTYSLSSSFLP